MNLLNKQKKLKKISIVFLLFFVGNSAIYACCNSETTDDRNDKSLVYDIATKIKVSEITIEQLSSYLQSLPSFLFIFQRNHINLRNVADVLATKVVQSQVSYKLSAAYTETVFVGTVDLDALTQNVKDVRKTLNIPNIESKCVIL